VEVWAYGNCSLGKQMVAVEIVVLTVKIMCQTNWVATFRRF